MSEILDVIREDLKPKVATDEAIAADLYNTRKELKLLKEKEKLLADELKRVVPIGILVIGEYMVEVDQRARRTVDWKMAYEDDVGLEERKKLEAQAKSGDVAGGCIKEIVVNTIHVKKVQKATPETQEHAPLDW